MPETEPQPQPSTLPIVPLEVTNRLSEYLNLDWDYNIPQVPEGRLSPSDAIDSLTTTLLANRQLPVTTIIDILRKNTYAHHDAKDAAKGMAIVLKTFDLMEKSGLIERLSSLQPDNISLAVNTLEQCFPPKKQSMTLSEQINYIIPEIPKQQKSLNQLIGKAKEHIGLEGRSFDQGATGMYKILEALWPKLYPPQTPPPPSA